MLKQRTAEGHSVALVKAIKKNGTTFSCEITSAVFTDEAGIQKSITGITDISQRILDQKNIDIKKEKIVAGNIALAKSTQKKIDIRKDKIVAASIDVAISKQKDIDTKKEKAVAGDIALAKSKQKKIDIRKEKIIAHNIDQAISKQKSIDIKKEKIVANNIELLISAQKNINAKNEKIVADNIALVKSKQKIIDIKKKKAVVDNIIIAKSKQKEIDIKKANVVSSDIKRASIKSHREKINYARTAREQLLAEIEKGFRGIFNSSSDVLFDSDLLANKVMINDAYEKEFGYKKTHTSAEAEDWLNHIHPDDKEVVMHDYLRMLASAATEWKYSFRFLKADNSVVTVLSKGIVLRDYNGKAYRRIGYLVDISKQKVMEERFGQQIRLREKQFDEAMRDAKEAERSDIGKELHDNVNQLLGASRMYLELAKRGGANSQAHLSRSSEYTLMAMEAIRKLTKGLTADFIRDLGLCDTIDSLASDTMEATSIKISCALKSFVEDSVNGKFKLNIYRIVQEHLNNIIKHAHASAVNISLLQNKRSIMLTISDNGIGFDTEKRQKGIGIANIKSRATAYNGMAEFVSREKLGCVLTVRFPLTDEFPDKL